MEKVWLEWDSIPNPQATTTIGIVEHWIGFVCGKIVALDLRSGFSKLIEDFEGEGGGKVKKHDEHGLEEGRPRGANALDSIGQVAGGPVLPDGWFGNAQRWRGLTIQLDQRFQAK